MGCKMEDTYLEADRRLVKIFGSTFLLYCSALLCAGYFSRVQIIPGRELRQIGDYQFIFSCTEQEQKEGQCITEENLVEVKKNTHKGKYCHDVSVYQIANPYLEPECNEKILNKDRLWNLYTDYHSLEERSEGEKED